MEDGSAFFQILKLTQDRVSTSILDFKADVYAFVCLHCTALHCTALLLVKDVLFKRMSVFVFSCGNLVV
jgi:hypothetical protein